MRSRNQNRGTRTGTVKPQEPWLQNRNRKRYAYNVYVHVCVILDESVDNSVPTLEEKPALEISLDQEPSEAYMPRGDIRQPQSKSSLRGDNSDRSPVEHDEINPTTVTATNQKPVGSLYDLGK